MSKEMSHETVKQQALNHRWVVLAALLFSFAAYAIVFQMVPRFWAVCRHSDGTDNKD